MEQNWEYKNKIRLFTTSVLTQFNEEKIILEQIVLRHLDSHLQEDELQPLPHSIHKKLAQSVS